MNKWCFKSSLTMKIYVTIIKFNNKTPKSNLMTYKMICILVKIMHKNHTNKLKLIQIIQIGKKKSKIKLQ